jgi:peroxiredoxin
MRLQLSLIILISAIWLSCKEEKAQETYKTGMEGKPMPPFAIQLLDSVSYVHSKDIAGDKKLVLFYFSTTCPYCRAQMRDMVNNIEKFRDQQLCLLSSDDLKSTKAFADYFELKDLKNVIVGRDTGNVIANTYHLISVPFTAYYNENKELKAAYAGRMTPNSLFRF